MQSGDLDTLFDVLQRTDGKNSGGQIKQIWTAIGQFYGGVEPISTQVFTLSHTQGSALVCRVVMRPDDFPSLNASLMIQDVDTKEILPNAKVILFDDKMNKISETTSSNNGSYSFKIECNKKYYVRASKEEYETTEKSFGPVTKTGESKLDIELKRNIFPVEVGTDLAKILDVSIIYFDLDKWNIRPDAAEDLEKIIAVMNLYPNMTIDIRSHTDSRQTHKYNELLSDRRAKSTLEFMVKNGINRNRLTAKGYGETQLVNNCSDDVHCSEAEHQKNRRSEFIILKM